MNGLILAIDLGSFNRLISLSERAAPPGRGEGLRCN